MGIYACALRPGKHLALATQVFFYNLPDAKLRHVLHAVE
jgi:hypothetical protein